MSATEALAEAEALDMAEGATLAYAAELWGAGDYDDFIAALASESGK